MVDPNPPPSLLQAVKRKVQATKLRSGPGLVIIERDIGEVRPGKFYVVERAKGSALEVLFADEAKELADRIVGEILFVCRQPAVEMGEVGGVTAADLVDD